MRAMFSFFRRKSAQKKLAESDLSVALKQQGPSLFLFFYFLSSLMVLDIFHSFPSLCSFILSFQVMRPPSDIKWEDVWQVLVEEFGMDAGAKEKYEAISKEEQLRGYEMMQLCRSFENACNQAYMQGKIRGFMHLDNGQVHGSVLCVCVGGESSLVVLKK